MNYGNKQVKGENVLIKPEPIRRPGPTSSPTFTLPSKDDIKTPKSIQGCKEMLDLGRKLLLTAAEYSGSGMKHKQRTLLSTCLDIVARKITIAKPGLSADRLLGLPRMLPSAAVTRPPLAQTSRESEASSKETRSFERFSLPGPVKTVDDSSEERSSSPTPAFSRRSPSSAHGGRSYREGGHRVRNGKRSPSKHSYGEAQETKRTRSRSRGRDRDSMAEKKSSSSASAFRRSSRSAHDYDFGDSRSYREGGHRGRNERSPSSGHDGYEGAQDRRKEKEG